MYDGIDYIRLVEQAQHGDRDSMDRLAEIARKRLGEHVYRITLQANLTQDIVQESMLEMFKVLGKLRQVDKFWPWLYGIAFNKIRHHNRSQGRKKTVSLLPRLWMRCGADWTQLPWQHAGTLGQLWRLRHQWLG